MQLFLCKISRGGESGSGRNWMKVADFWHFFRGIFRNIHEKWIKKHCPSTGDGYLHKANGVLKEVFVQVAEINKFLKISIEKITKLL